MPPDAKPDTRAGSKVQPDSLVSLAIIAMLAHRWKSKRILKGGVIGTLMSNYGLENFLKK